ncbi:MAG: DUF362 domain-containing protein [Candidatus Aminicenantes bacterium]|nr:DUF362 domain-containing protein [Candidatus Aminicenantes bacterium]
MSEKKIRSVTRRKFIHDTSLAVIGTTLLTGAPGSLFSETGKPVKSTVVLIRDKNVLDEKGAPRFNIVQEMLDKAVTVLTGKDDPVKGWKTIIRPDDIVGIKSNVWKYINTTSEVEEALKKRVMGAGVSEENISISDRGVLRDPVFKKATALINARPMRTHHWSGVGSLIKNYIMFIPKPSTIHDDSCADLGKLWNLPLVKDKTRLNVLVMFTPQFHNVGPHGFNPKYVWKYYGMLVGFDPVSIDYMGLNIILSQRKVFFGEDRPLSPHAKHIVYADTRHHIGNADPKNINLIKIGYEKDILI